MHDAVLDGISAVPVKRSHDGSRVALTMAIWHRRNICALRKIN